MEKINEYINQINQVNAKIINLLDFLAFSELSFITSHFIEKEFQNKIIQFIEKMTKSLEKDRVKIIMI